MGLSQMANVQVGYLLLGKDEGYLSRSGGFQTDSSVPASCQPQNGKSDRTNTVNPATGTWGRGPLVPANHMD